jgi:phosphoglycolate phosphatase
MVPVTTVLFDLDGTLIDSAPDVYAAVASLIEDLGLTPPTETQVRGFIGNGLAITLERSLRAVDGPPPNLPMVEKLTALYAARPAVRTRPYPGVEKVLDEFLERGLRLAVATNKTTDLSRMILDQLGLGDHFELVAGGDAVPAMKPDPGHINYCLEKMDAAPEETVMVGDSVNDIRAANGAGCLSILLSYGYGPQRDVPGSHLPDGGEPDLRGDRFTDLPELIFGAASLPNSN